MRPLIVTGLLLALTLTACGAIESGAQSASAEASPAAAAPDTAPANDDSAAPSAAASEATDSAVPSVAADAEASSTLDVGEAIDFAASAVAAASAANAAAGPSDDGCPSAMTPANPERSSLAAAWNPGGTITVEGGLDVPADATLMMFTYQDGSEVGWAQFGSFGMIEAATPFEQTSSIPEADDIIYGEMAKANPYQPGSLVCVALMAIRGDISVDDMMDPAKRDEALLTRVRMPVTGEAPSEITLP